MKSEKRRNAQTAMRKQSMWRRLELEALEWRTAPGEMFLGSSLAWQVPVAVGPEWGERTHLAPEAVKIHQTKTGGTQRIRIDTDVRAQVAAPDAWKIRLAVDTSASERKYSPSEPNTDLVRPPESDRGAKCEAVS